MAHVTQVNPGKGTLLKVKISAAQTTIAQRVSLDGPEMEVGTAETTNLDSAKKTYRPTIADGGSMSGTLQYDPHDPTHLFLFGLWDNPLLATFQLVFADADATTATFDGVLTKLKPTGMEVEGNLEAEFEIKVSGEIVLSAAPA
ncbi:hypothetical protein SAMN05444166_6280 [Singulisphaera sp. GP187]|uniref:phage tail tube protein n=1 Tax=Singulisphaera sp. GP187 TaxID=1882752 RepID=UPI0009258D14|nr:hypothetical protein [Singulisphaera sp. GP187]SIO60136.1 hypothetical protein SAMN05444166_6280 [Singulisphaera sp. GP187]